MKFFADMPWWFFLVALVVSAYQSYRGFLFQMIFTKPMANKQNKRSKSEEKTSEHVWTHSETVILRCVADALLYLITTFSGFLAIYGANNILSRVGDIRNISGGTASVVIFMLLYGILGISGQLPHLLQQGKFPWSR